MEEGKEITSHRGFSRVCGVRNSKAASVRLKIYSATVPFRQLIACVGNTCAEGETGAGSDVLVMVGSHGFGKKESISRTMRVTYKSNYKAI